MDMDMDMGTPCGGCGTDHRVHMETERAICNVYAPLYVCVHVSVDVDAYRYIDFHMRVHVCLAMARRMVTWYMNVWACASFGIVYRHV